MHKKLLKTAITVLMSVALTISYVTPSFAAEAVKTSCKITAPITIEKGDTLSGIAKDFNISVSDIKAANKISNANMIHEGQVINITVDSDNIVGRARLASSVLSGRINENAHYKGLTLEAPESKNASLRNIPFDPDFYKANNPDVVNELGDSYATLLNHYLEYGLWETRSPNENFNINVYGSAYIDLFEALKNEDSMQRVLDLYKHYIEYGKSESREITTLQKAKENGISVFSALDNNKMVQEAYVPTSEPESEPANTVYTLEMFGEDSFEAFYTFIFNMAADPECPEDIKNIIEAQPITKDNIATIFETVENLIEHKEPSAFKDRYGSDAGIAIILALIDKVSLTEEYAEFYPFYVANKPMTINEYERRDYFTFDGQIKDGKIGYYDGIVHDTPFNAESNYIANFPNQAACESALNEYFSSVPRYSDYRTTQELLIRSKIMEIAQTIQDPWTAYAFSGCMVAYVRVSSFN